MPMPVYFVEGEMEQRIVQRLCPGAPVRKLGINGDNVKAKPIAVRIRLQAASLSNRFFPIIVIIDRERRKESATSFRTEILNEMDELGLDLAQYRIVIADRCTENWIIPFLETDCLTINSKPCRTNSQGRHGKSMIKSLFKKAKGLYHETTTGVKLFCQLNPQEVSKLFDEFRYLIDSVDDKCDWINRSEST